MMKKHDHDIKLLAFVTLVALTFAPATVRAQGKPPAKIPSPEPVTLQTRDGVVLACYYYQGGFVMSGDGKISKLDGKKVVPVVLLHGWEGRAGEFDILASFLQRMGHAVVVPDLRGHGRSTTVKTAAGDAPIDREKMRPRDMESTLLDCVAIKKFLVEKHNAGELNIELLTAVGSEFGSIIAVNWALYDWTRKSLPTYKQGQDLKGLVLLSPKYSFKGVSLRQALAAPQIKANPYLSLMIIAGGEDSSRSDASRIHKYLEGARDEPEDVSQKTLFKYEPSTSLRGTRLLRSRSLKVNQYIAQFIQLRLVAHRDDLPWKERTNPLDRE